MKNIDINTENYPSLSLIPTKKMLLLLKESSSLRDFLYLSQERIFKSILKADQEYDLLNFYFNIHFFYREKSLSYGDYLILCRNDKFLDNMIMNFFDVFYYQNEDFPVQLRSHLTKGILRSKLSYEDKIQALKSLHLKLKVPTDHELRTIYKRKTIPSWYILRTYGRN